MRYYSELVKKFYDTEKDCQQAEVEYKKAQEAKLAEEKQKSELRSKRAKEIEEAYKVAVEANNKYQELLRAFIKDYKSYHMTINDVAVRDAFIDDFFTSFFRLF